MPHPLNKQQEKFVRQIAERVRAIREAKGMTLQEVAHAIGKDHQSIYRLEQGNTNPSIVFLKEVCEGLEVELSELLKGL